MSLISRSFVPSRNLLTKGVRYNGSQGLSKWKKPFEESSQQLIGKPFLDTVTPGEPYSSPLDGKLLTYSPISDTPEIYAQKVQKALDAGKQLQQISADRLALYHSFVVQETQKLHDPFCAAITAVTGTVPKESSNEVQEMKNSFMVSLGMPAVFTKEQSIEHPDPEKMGKIVRVPRNLAAQWKPSNFFSIVTKWSAISNGCGVPMVVLASSKAGSDITLALLDGFLRKTITQFNHDFPGKPLPVDMLVPIYAGQQNGATLGQLMAADESNQIAIFTGSTSVGQAVVKTAAQRGIPVLGEWEGGNNGIVLDQSYVDKHGIDAVVAEVYDSAFGRMGQRCTSTGALYVSGNCSDFKVKLLEYHQHFCQNSIGDPNDSKTVLATPFTHDVREEMFELKQAVLQLGAAVYGGDIPQMADYLQQGAWVTPLIIVLPKEMDTKEEEKLLSKKLFGPVLFVKEVSDTYEGIKELNKRPHRLAAAVASYNEDHINRSYRDLGQFGVLNVGFAHTTRAALFFGFQGNLLSGFASEGASNLDIWKYFCFRQNMNIRNNK